MNNPLKLLQCSRDGGDLILEQGFLLCKKCSHKYPYQNNILFALEELDEDASLSKDKWEELYQTKATIQKIRKENQKYLETYFQDVYFQVNSERSLSGAVYLEIGCGPAFFAQEVSHECALVIGVDFSKEALQIASQQFIEKGIKNYLLIHADIGNMPIKSDTIDVLYGGGVIEHFKDTLGRLRELQRVLVPGGVSFNTVPCCNLGSLTYRQIWGNIPNLPLIRQIAELVHIKLLGGRHMIFGYELSFRPNTLRQLHREAGFSKVKVRQFKIQLEFAFLPSILRPIMIWLANNSSLFWPMIKVVARK